MISSNPLINIPEEEDTEDMCQAEREWGMEREEKGKSRISKLVNILLSENRLDDIKRVTEDKDYCDKLLKEFKLDV